jgi:hypothetical protein
MNKISEVGRVVRNRRIKTVVDEGGIPTAARAKTTQLARPEDLPALDETLKEHREEALKRGRRHKRQLKKGRFSVMLTSLSLIAVIGCLFFSYSFYLLEKRQSYSSLAYSLARLVPYNASNVDGEKVSYEDYLFILRQNVHYLVNFEGVGAEKIDVSTEDGNRIIEQKKIEALAQAEGYAFVNKKARELHIAVSSKEVDGAIDELLVLRGNSTRAELTTTLKAHYGWGLKDYERFYSQVILKRKVLASLDEEAKLKIDTARERVQAGEDFGAVASELSDDAASKAAGGSVGRVNLKLNNANFSYTVLETLKNLGEGQVSEPVVTNEAFYIFKNVKTYSENEKDILMIKVVYKPVDVYLKQLEDEGKIKRSLKLKPLVVEDEAPAQP